MKPKIMIATPMYGGMCGGEYTRSMITVPVAMAMNDMEASFAFIMNNSLVQHARNVLADIFMQHDFTHLMFIDADIKFNPMDIVSMVKADKDVLCGIYPKKKINWEMINDAVQQGVPPQELTNYTGDLVVNLVGYGEAAIVSASEPAEVYGGGTGFMLIKRSVFETLQDKVERFIEEDCDDREIGEYFYLQKDPEVNRQLSEDYVFCRLCRANGIKIYAAPWVKLGHFGTYMFEGAVIPVKQDTQGDKND